MTGRLGKIKQPQTAFELFALQVSIQNAKISEAAIRMLISCGLDNSRAVTINEEYQDRVAKRKPDG